MTDPEDAGTPRRNRRGFRWERCAGCQLPVASCICAVRPAIDTDIAFWLLMHHEEILKPTNTGRLIADCIDSTRISEWSRTPPDEWSAVRAADTDCYVVFPDDYPPRASRFVPFPEDRSRNRLFILLDGTWAQVRKMMKKAEYLEDVPIVAIQPEFASAYGLRRASDPDKLCTAEVAVALLEMAGEVRAADLFRSYFKLFDLQYRIARFGPASVGAGVEERDGLLEKLAAEKDSAG